MVTNDKVRENKVRRELKRRGQVLAKNRARDPRSLNYGGYMVIDPNTNVVVRGASRGFGYELSLEEVEALTVNEP